MELLTATPARMANGTYNVKMDMSSGDARLQWRVGKIITFQDIPDTVKTASAGFTLDLPNCTVQSLITGDATVQISLVRR